MKTLNVFSVVILMDEHFDSATMNLDIFVDLPKFWEQVLFHVLKGTFFWRKCYPELIFNRTPEYAENKVRKIFYEKTIGVFCLNLLALSAIFQFLILVLYIIRTVGLIDYPLVASASY